jgi:hypothetical protein
VTAASNNIIIMCGNFGLLLLYTGKNSNDASETSSPQEAAKFNSGSVKGVLLPAIHILEAQTAATEVRGGQAGGYSALEYIRTGLMKKIAITYFNIDNLSHDTFP